MKRSACIDALYQEIPFLDRFQAAKDDGFDAVEFWGWPEKDLNAVKEAAEKAGIPICGFNGDADLSLIDPEQTEAYMEYLEKSCETAKFLNAPCVTIHSNGLGDGGIVINHYDNLSDTVKTCTMFRNLEKCAALAEKTGIQMNLEGLNITTDHVGNYRSRTSATPSAMSTSRTRLAATSPAPARSTIPGCTGRSRRSATPAMSATNSSR